MLQVFNVCLEFREIIKWNNFFQSCCTAFTPLLTHSPLALSCGLSHSLSLTLPLFLPLSHCDFAAALINSMPRNGRVSNELLMNCFLACALFMLLPDWKIVIYTHTHIHMYIYIFVFWYTRTCVCASVCASVPSLWQRMFDPQSCRPKKPLQLAISLALPPSLSLSISLFSRCVICVLRTQWTGTGYWKPGDALGLAE